MDGGTPGGSNAGLFLPPGQGAVAGQLGSLVGPMAGQSINALEALGGVSPAQRAYPFVQGTTSNVLNNPYAGGPIAGGNVAADLFTNQIIPSTFTAAPNLSNLGLLATGQAGSIPGLTYNNPAYGSAATTGASLSPTFAGYAPQAISAGFAPNAPLSQGASSILSTAFDPQQALFDQLRQRQLDTSNAVNAMSGIAGTPYGAGVTNQNLQNFDINWENQRLGREATGLNAAGQAYGQGISDIATGANAGTGLGSAALSSLLTPANNQTAATAEGTSALGGLIDSASRAFGGGVGALGQLASWAPSFLGAPYNAYQGIQGNNFGALQNEIALGNQNYVLPQQTIGDINQYLNLGQSASGLANSIGATNFNESAALGQGGINALGAGSNLLFGNQGLSGGLGGTGGAFSTGGLFGSQGPLFGTAADASIASGGPPLAAAAPLAFS